MSGSSLFKWAFEQDNETTMDNTRKASAINEEDPIAALLASNQSILETRSFNFAPHKLNFQKMVNANYGHEH